MSSLYTKAHLYTPPSTSPTTPQPHTQPSLQPICRDFQNGRCFRGSCRFYHGTADDFAVANAAGMPGFRAYDKNTMPGYLPIQGHSHHLNHLNPHSVHALQRVMSLPSGGLPPFLGANGNSLGLHQHPHSFDAAALAAMHGGWPGGDSAAAAVLVLAATQTSQHRGVPPADPASLLALQSAQLQRQQQQMMGGDVPANNVRAMTQANEWAAIQAQQAVSANTVPGGVAGVPPQGPQTPSPVNSGLLTQSLGHSGQGHVNGHGVVHNNVVHANPHVHSNGHITHNGLNGHTNGHGGGHAPAEHSHVNAEPGNGVDIFPKMFFANANGGDPNQGVPQTTNGNGFYGPNASATGVVTESIASSGMWSTAGSMGDLGSPRELPGDPNSRRASFNSSLNGGLWEEKSGVLAAARSLSGSPRTSLDQRASLDGRTRSSFDQRSSLDASREGVSVGGGGGCGFHGNSPLGTAHTKLPVDLHEPPSSRGRSSYSLF